MYKKRKNIVAKIVAGLALLWIIAGIIGTGILVLFSGGVEENTETLSQEQIDQLIQDYEATQSGETLSGSNLIIDSISE